MVFIEIIENKDRKLRKISGVDVINKLLDGGIIFDDESRSTSICLVKFTDYNLEGEPKVRYESMTRFDNEGSWTDENFVSLDTLLNRDYWVVDCDK
jgi:hypothetical protein